MADNKVSSFNVETTIDDADIFPFVRPGNPDPNKNSIITGANLKTQINYPAYANFSAFPSAAANSGKIVIALAGEGVYLINRKSAGLYYSDGVSWSRLGNIPAYFSDTNLKIYNGSDNTKLLGWDLSAQTTGVERTVTTPDRNLNLSTPTFDSLTVLGDGTFSQASAEAILTVETAGDVDAEVRLMNAAGEWDIEVNGGNADLLIQKDTVNAIIVGGNITSGTGMKMEQGTTSFNIDGIDRNFKVFGLDGGGGAPELLEVDAGLGRVKIAGGVSPTGPSEALDVNGNILVSGTINTGQGATELYLMNQNVRTSDSPSFTGATFTDSVTVTEAGTTGFTITDTTNGTALLNAGSEFDFRWSKTTGSCIMDFEGRPLDGTSNAEYRFGLNSGSTGENRIVLFAPNGTTRHSQIQTSGTSYLCQSGGNLAVGGTSQLSSARFSVYGSVVYRPPSSLTLTANADFGVEATSNTTLTFKYRGSDGVTRSANLTLA